MSIPSQPIQNQKDIKGELSVKPRSTENQTLPPNQIASILAALLLCMEFDNDMQKTFADLQKDWALAYAGSKDGKTIDTSGKSGILNLYYNNAVGAADQNANATKYEGIALAVGAGIGVAALAGSAKVMTGGADLKAVDQELAQLQNYKTGLSAPEVGGEYEMNGLAENREIGHRMTEIENGIRLNDHQGDQVAIQQLNLNQERRLNTLKKVDETIQNKQTQKTGLLNEQHGVLNVIGQGNNSLGSTSQAVGTMAKADAQRKAGKNQAESEVAKTIESQLGSYINNAKTASDSHHDEANRWAQAIAQAAQSQVRG